MAQRLEKLERGEKEVISYRGRVGQSTPLQQFDEFGTKLTGDKMLVSKIMEGIGKARKLTIPPEGLESISSDEDEIVRLKDFVSLLSKMDHTGDSSGSRPLLMKNGPPPTLVIPITSFAILSACFGEYIPFRSRDSRKVEGFGEQQYLQPESDRKRKPGDDIQETETPETTDEDGVYQSARTGANESQADEARNEHLVASHNAVGKQEAEDASTHFDSELKIIEGAFCLLNSGKKNVGFEDEDDSLSLSEELALRQSRSKDDLEDIAKNFMRATETSMVRMDAYKDAKLCLVGNDSSKWDD
ncbi:uncharacterized protein Z518_09876 [Rhinocladiella mackenziei CBS 650.93]|uniref:Rhinocladiella mackenziei CBS 650.93 unplaced genomic scaffold supercont1.8, whole genome shotgun sequence n=1 Tax=Rhinocladiella mackenziei CBS 650.93 TaxID=1442369 RepID=A0A0D2IC24_9EURO|nr:uncharacterized protein Z518_09876 [Rhinocladiella mackenziei CBS 650.93]KIX00811.1 hypothetical protein Z518_09876 [Rhinocladiella mackenziei CBS 650.93]